MERFINEYWLSSVGDYKMDQLEENITKSFRLAKNDIIQLQNQVIELSKNQERIMEIVSKIKDVKPQVVKVKQEAQKVKVVRVKAAPQKVKVVRVKTPQKIKIVNKYPHKRYVAAKEGKKFHIRDCPFAQNIKPKGKITFKAKKTALNAGYKPCNCVR